MSYRAIPPGVEHFFYNTTTEGTAEVVGLYVGASDLQATGYVFVGAISEDDLARSRRGVLSDASYPAGLISEASTQRLQNHSDEATCRELLKVTDPLAASVVFITLGSRPLDFAPRAEVIFFIVRGTGRAGDAASDKPVRAGHVWFTPPGRRYGLQNVSSTAPLELLAFITGGDTYEAAGIAVLPQQG